MDELSLIFNSIKETSKNSRSSSIGHKCMDRKFVKYSANIQSLKMYLLILLEKYKIIITKKDS